MQALVVYANLMRQSVRALGRRKGRSALTTIGIALGIAAVVWVVAIGRAGSDRTEKLLSDLGDNLVWVEAGSRNVAGVRTGTRGTNTLTMGDADAIAREIPGVDRMSPNIDGKVGTISAYSNWQTSYRGVTPSYFPIKKWTIASGSAFSDDDVERARNVCVIGERVRERLFGQEASLGQVIRVNGQPFEVVGVLAAKGQTGTGQDQDDTLILPYTTAQRKIRAANMTWLDDILISASADTEISRVTREIKSLLRQRHRITAGQDEDFNIRHPEEAIQAQLEAGRTFSTLLVSVAAVSLLVGGVGIMNVMLASVTERTKEIGVRLAIGAKMRAIEFQFLAESIALCLAGGLVGIAASLAGASALEKTLGWPLTISIDALVVALAFSVFVGVTFGYLPARRAARLDPIEALRSE